MEDLKMDGTTFTSSLNSDRPLEDSARSTSCCAGTEPSTEESEQSVDDSGPSTPIHNPYSVEENDHIRVIKPYAIEEPDDEPESIMSWPDVPCLPDRFERWQRDLADYMDDLNYQPEELDSNRKPAVRRRGQKRKTAHGATQHCYPHLKQRHESAHARDFHTKRQKCSKQFHEHHRSRDSFEGFREANVHESSSPEAQSINLSGTDTMSNSPMADEMDID